jgi:hypothetical protein
MSFLEREEHPTEDVDLTGEVSSKMPISIRGYMNRKFIIFALGVMLFALCVSAEAQQPTRMFRVGYLAVRSGTGPLDSAVKTRLRELGYVGGQTISFAH